MAGQRSSLRVTAYRAVAGALLLVLLPVAPALAAGRPSNADLEAKAAGLQARLDEQYAALERISERFDKATAAELDLRANLAGVQARRQAVVAELAAAQERLDEQARETYEAGPGWFVSELVGASDPSDLLRRLPLQKAALEASARTVDEVAKRKAELDGLSARASNDLAVQQRLDAGVLSQHQRINSLAKQLEATLKGIDKRLAGVLDAQQRRAEAGRRAAYSAWFNSLGGRGQASWMDAGGAAATAVAYAMRQLGKPYQWGAAGPAAFDCSGLTSSAYLAAGIVIPRVSADQFNAGPHVAVADLLAGDLVFYADDPALPATIHHVGMYIGNGLMVHAPHTGDVVRVASIWRQGYAGAVRVVAASQRPGVSPPPTTAPLPPPPMTAAPPKATAPPASQGPPAGSATTTPAPGTAPGTTRPPATTEPPTTAPATTEPPTTASPTTAAATSATAAGASTTGDSSSSASSEAPATIREPTTTAEAPTTTEAPATTGAATTTSG
jgi:peptidoglycan DL-endopeptidase CwlO